MDDMIAKYFKELRDTESGSSESWGLAAFDEDAFLYMYSMPWFAEKYQGIRNKDELKARYESSDDEQDKKYLEVGKRAFECKQKYGYTSWYDWSNANWGTKWNAYQVRYIAGDEHKIVLEFQTAWAYPEPVLDKLMEQGFEVNGFWEDEGGGDGEIGDNAWGVFDKQTVYEYLG